MKSILKYKMFFFKMFILVIIFLSLLFVYYTNRNEQVSHEVYHMHSNKESSELIIGVNITTNYETTLEEWEPTADYLSDSIEGHTFSIMPLDDNELDYYVNNNEIDFVLTNSAQYIKFEVNNDVNRLATLIRNINGEPISNFGSVIFTRSDNENIFEIEDIKNKRIAAVDETSFGGWQAALVEMLHHNINPVDDSKELIFLGDHNLVVYNILDKKSDIGVVKTGILEKMSMNGLLKLEEIRVLDKNDTLDYPLKISTPIYPGWPLAKLNHISDETGDLVASLLIEMKSDSIAAKSSNTFGWSIPSNYQAVREALQNINSIPYEDYGKLSVVEFIVEYIWFLLLLVVVLIIFSVVFFRLKITKEALVEDIILREKTENKLIKSEEELKLVLQSVEKGIIVVDLDGNTNFINHVALELLGYEEEEMIGKSVHEIIHHTHSDGSKYEKCTCPMNKSYTDGSTNYIDDEVLWKKSGESFFVEYTSVPIINDEEIIGAVILFRDSTYRKKAEKVISERTEELTQYLEAIEQSPVVVLITDLTGRILYANPKFTETTGYSNEEVIGENIKILKSGKMSEEFYEDLWSTVLAGDQWKGEICNKDKYGNLFWENMSISPILNEDNEIVKIIAVKEDITSKRSIANELKKSKEDLQIKNQLIHGTLDSANIGIWWIDFTKEDTFYAIDTAVKLLGLKVSESEEQSYNISTWIENMHKTYEYYPEYTEIINSTLKTFFGNISGETNINHISFPSLQEDNSIIWIESRVEIPERFEDGTAKLMTGTLRDITEQRKAAEVIKTSESRLILAAESANLGLWDFFPKENRSITNRIWATQLQYDPLDLRKSDTEWSEELEGSTFWLDSLHPDDKDEVIRNFEDHLNGKTDLYKVENRLRCKDGSYKWILAIGKVTERDESGDALRVIGIHIDIDEIKKNEFELSKAKEAAEAATLAKDEFLANMSHEIRTPINGVLGLNELLSKTNLNDRQLDYVNKIGRSAENLLNIINDILDFTKIESGNMELEVIEFNIQEVIEDLLAILMIKVKDGNVDLLCKPNFDVPVILKGDPHRLGQVLLNLAGNALKFTERGKVEIDIKVESIENNVVVLKFLVEDTGIGMSEEQMSKLFNTFTQADTSTSRKYGGTGLGLSISKRLVEKMNGELYVESELNVGSKFYAIIPFEIGNSTSKALLHKKNDRYPDGFDDVRGRKILLVEDNEINQQIVKETLESEGFIVDVADDGKIAVSKINENDYDLVLMDLQMPNLNGYQATKIIRESHSRDELSIIALTADVFDGISDKVLSVGMNEYLTKPINKYKLFFAIEKFIKKHDREVVIQEIKQEEDEIVSTELLIETLKNIDVNGALDRITGNKKLYLKLLKMFNMESDVFCDEILLTVINNLDLEEGIKKAHALKGVAGNLGAKSLYELLASVEMLLKNDNFNKNLFKDLINDISSELAIVKGQCKVLFDNLDNKEKNVSKKSVAISNEKLLNELNRLKSYIEEYDMDVEVIYEELEQYLSDSEDFKLMGTFIEDLDYLAALEVCERIIASVNN